jgi:hypothetical protein
VKDLAIEAGVQIVTPKLASQWLGSNDGNRNVRERVVSAYVRDMKAGRWRLTGEAVKFAHDGRLLDGQHRLRAIVAANKPIPMLVVRGLSDEAQEVIDSGAARTAGDALRMRGEGNYAALAAGARLAMQYQDGRLYQGGNTKYTHSEIIEFLAKHTDMRTAVDIACGYSKQIDIPLSVLSLSVWRLMQVDPSDCAAFFSRLADKTGLTKGDAVLALLNRLTEVRRSNRQLDRGDYLSLVFRAWNYWRTGKAVQSLPVISRGAEVDIPQPR